MKILNTIQKELNAPKNQRNNFGNYNYRSCEDILSAVKPLLGEAILTLNDEIVLIGDRYYIKATASISHGEHMITSTAYAREDVSKKGMDLSQLTGSCSSYARKYALNGLFCIDDTKDADTQDNTTQSKPVYSEQEDDKEWLNLDKNQKALDGIKEFYNKGMTAEQVVRQMRTKYKVSKKTAAQIEALT